MLIETIVGKDHRKTISSCVSVSLGRLLMNLFVSFVKFRKAQVGKSLKFSQDAQDAAMRFGNPEVEARAEKRKRWEGARRRD